MAKKSARKRSLPTNIVSEPEPNNLTTTVVSDGVKKRENKIHFYVFRLIFGLTMLALLGLAVYYLSFLPKDKTPTVIELIATVSSVEFQITTKKPDYLVPLLGNLALESIDVPNFKKVQFFWTDSPPSDFEDVFEASEMESLGAGILVNETSDIIGIDEVLIPDKTKVELKKLIEPDGKFQLALVGDDIGLTVQTEGLPKFSVTGVVPNKDSEQGNEKENSKDELLNKSFNLPAGKGTDIDFSPLPQTDEPEELVMNFIPKLEESSQARLIINEQESINVETRDSTEILFGEQIEISNLSLTRINESQRAADGSRVPLIVSAIESGTLYLEELNGKAIPLRPGEQLRFKVLKGTIRKLSLQDGLITVQFRGTVEGMISGFVDSRSLMPNWLEYILAREAWLAVLGGIVSALTLLFAYMQGRGAMR